jgi:hypothetical protein
MALHGCGLLLDVAHVHMCSLVDLGWQVTHWQGKH